MGYDNLTYIVFYFYLYLGNNLQVVAGFGLVQNTTQKCANAIVTTMVYSQACSTNSQTWITYTVNATYPVIPSALVDCIVGKGFPWQETCDWSINWFVKPNQLLVSDSCNVPPNFLKIPGC